MRFRSFIVFICVLFFASTCFGLGEYTKLNFKGSQASTTEVKGQLTSYSVVRDSSATYVDSDGVLQTADGDSSGSVTAVDDETGVTAQRGSFYDGQAWYRDDNTVLSAQAGTNYLLALVDSAGKKAYGYIGAAEGGEALGSDLFDANKGTFTEASLLGTEGIQDTDNQNFDDGTINEWVVSRTGGAAAGTCAYDNTDLGYANEPDADDNQALLTSSADDTLYGVIDTAASGASVNLTANTLHKLTVVVAVAAANTLKDAKWVVENLTGAILVDGTTTLAGDTWTTLTGYLYCATDVTGNVGLGFDGNPTDGDLLYYSDISIKPLTLSWTPYGTNTMEIDSNALKITYVDNANGAVLELHNGSDFSSNLVIGKQYKWTGNAKVSAGGSVQLGLNDGKDTEIFETITSTSFVPFEYYFTAQSTTGCATRMGSMGAGESIWLDSLVLTEVTTADAQAVTIYKEPSLLTEGYAVIESGFDYNDSSMTFDIYSNIPSATGAGAEARLETNGLLNEGAGTNWAIYARDMTNAIWVKSNITALKDVTGQDGSANSASRLTAGANNGTILQTLPTMASATHCYSMRMKRITGTGAIYMTADNGGTWTEKTLTSSWQRFSVTKSTTTPIIGIKMATSGDVIGVDYNQFEQSQAYYTSDIPTTTIPAARTADTQKWTMSTAFKNLMGNTADSPFTMVVEVTPKFAYTDISANQNLITIKGATSSILECDNNGYFESLDGTNTASFDSDFASGTSYIIALRNTGADLQICASNDSGSTWGTWVTTGAYDGSFNPSTHLQLGYGNIYPFNIGFIHFYNRAMTQDWVERNMYSKYRHYRPLGGGVH